VSVLCRSSTGQSSDEVEEVLSAEHVVVTASLGVLKRSVAGAAGNLLFEPPLPSAKVAAVQRLGFGTVDKLLLRYAEPWWEPLWAKLHLLWPSGDEGLAAGPSWQRGVYSFSPEPLGRGLECWFSGAAAREMETCSEAEIASALHALLLRCAGPVAKAPPLPLGVVRSCWGSKLGFFGSYSYVPVGSSGADIDELAVPEGEALQLLLAGEHTHRSSYSYVHGAWQSGHRAADAIAAHYGLET